MRQRGFGVIDFAIYAIGIVAILGAVYMVIHSVTTFIDNTRREGFDAGQETALRATADRDNKKLVEAVAKAKELADRVVKMQADLDRALVEADNSYQKGIADGNEKKESVLADIRSGRLVVRDPGRQDPGSGCPGTGAPVVPGTGSNPGVDNGAKGAPLSSRLADFLVRQFSQCDADLRQLGAAQDAIVALQGTLLKCRGQ